MLNFKDLPDIDRESPETFENQVFNKQQEKELEIPQENCNIETTSILPTEATKVFANKTVKNKHVIYSSETKTQKLDRLAQEFHELSLEVENEPSNEISDNIEHKISKLKDNLESVTGRLNLSSKYQNEHAKLELFRRIKSAKSNTSIDLQNINSKPLAESDSKNNKISFDLFCDENRTDLILQDLETRIAFLEKTIGASFHQFHEKLPQGDIITTLDRLEEKLNILSDPETLDALSFKLKQIEPIIDNSKDKLANEEKVDALYKALHFQTLHMLPQVLSRLVTLKKVHDSAIIATSTFDSLYEKVENGTKNIHDLKKSMEKIKITMNENMDIIKGNVSSLNERIERLQANNNK